MVCRMQRTRRGPKAKPKTRRTRRSRRRLKGGQQPSLEVRYSAGSPTEPTVSWRYKGKLHTLICIDPDAAATPWLHWLVTNCKGASPSTGTTITPWAPPTPPPGTGTHRYQFKLLEQVRPIQTTPPASRASFPFQAFLKSNALKEVASAEVRVAAPPPAAA
jgi:phosphatidylethanolamine-binding protein (PEBP) family uncharacterized protein